MGTDSRIHLGQSSKSLTGEAWIALSCVLSAACEVWLANLAQELDPMAINIACLGTVGLVYFAFCSLRNGPRLFSRAHANWKDVLLINLGTFLTSAGAIVGFRMIEPAAVKVIFCSCPPFLILALGPWLVSGERSAGARQRWAAGGTGLSVAILFYAILAGKSGMATTMAGSGVAIGIAASLICGLGLSINFMLMKRLETSGWEISEIMAVRFFGLIVGGLPLLGAFGGRPLSPSDLPAVAALAFLSVVLPLYTFQVGLKKSTTLGASLVYASGPALTVLFQQFDSRLSVSPLIWAAVALNVLSSVAALTGREP